MTPRSPAVSVILVADRLETIRTTLAHFRAQAGAEEIEVVVVAPHGAIPDDAPELSGFASTRIVAVDDVCEPPLARATAVHVASAPLVLLAETHAFPRPGYVEALRRAHRAGPWFVVGPSIANGNPATLVSWANILLDYGPWLDATATGPAADVPGHNAAYKRDVLLGLGDGLGEALRADNLMHAELRRRGGQLYLEPAACVEHHQVSNRRRGLLERFHSGRDFAGHRIRGWPLWRRWAYAVGSPLIPPIRLARIQRDIRRSAGARERLPELLPVLVLALILSAAGELVGYLRGPGRSSRILYGMEVRRADHIRRGERFPLPEGES